MLAAVADKTEKFRVPLQGHGLQTATGVGQDPRGYPSMNGGCMAGKKSATEIWPGMPWRNFGLQAAFGF